MNRRCQTGATVGENQTQRSAFESPPVQILQECLPIGLTLALATQESQQMPAAIAPDAIRHQHLHSFAARRSPHPQAHSIQKQIDVVVAQPRLMKLAHRSVSPVMVATTRPTCRVEIPRKNASRISSETSSARR